MIDHIEIANYRSLRRTALRPGPLTCLIGPNGSGKSNFLEVLELLRAAACEELSAFVGRRQGYAALPWFGSPENEIDIRARVRIHGKPQVGAVRYEVRLAASGGSYVVAQEFLKPYRVTPGKPTEYIKNIGGQGNLYNEEREGPDIVPSKGDPGPGPRETFLGHFRAPRHYSIVSRAQECFRNWGLLSFARIDTRPGSPARSPRPLGEMGRLEQDGSNLTDTLGFLQEKHPQVFDDIRRSTRAAFREIESIAVRPLVGTNLWVTRAKVAGAIDEVPVWSLSDGVIRYLCLAAALLSPVPSPVLILDEPEVGMHPALAPNVAELLHAASEGTRQVFVATHSADLVDQMSPREVVVLEKTLRSGETVLRPIADDEDLAGWVAGYRLGELWREGHLGGKP
ncbi:MAG: AAA family ATPase [Planctomycetes bacterium]|nr:AAA family ATPase [Planctomycetota bacterium]